MLMDKTTEMVAHLIGIFHTSVEEVRLRDVYGKFKALQAEDLENNEIDAITASFKAGYRLEGFAPNLDYTPAWLQENSSGPAASVIVNFADYLPSNAVESALPVAPLTLFSTVWNGQNTQLVLEPPGSVAVITLQSAFLSDNDLLLLGDGETVFADPSTYLEALQQYQTVATAIAAPVSAQLLQPGETATADALALHAQITSVEASTISGVTTTILQGDDAFGLHINGGAVEDLLRLDEVLPAYLRAQTADEPNDGSGASSKDSSNVSAGEEGAPDAAPGENSGENASEEDYVWPDPFEGLNTDDGSAGDFHIEAGHTVVVGGNTMVNDVQIHSAWLDAPMISVMGDAINLEVIAQVNVLVNHDSGGDTGSYSAGAGSLTASAVLSGAGMSFISSLPTDEEVDETAEASEDEATAETDTTEADTGLPSNWAVTRIEGDLISYNYVNQYSFQTDHDRAEISFSSTNTYISLGDNTVANLTSLSELGFGYDLIFAGGSMISVNWINQMNVLIDNDWVTYSDGTPTSIGSGDNLLFNSATINGIGLDTHEEMSTTMESASESLEAGNVGFNSAVANDPVFEGIDVLRVLYVEGDLMAVNWIEQTNILGDSDQVHLAMANLEGETGAEINVTAGSNAVINLASIHEYGTDSTVSVGGEVYDDALLYQAELIDTDADPIGVDLSALASEAVAFLAEDMLQPEVTPGEDAIMATAPEDFSSADVMQTMLA
ncbi:hypothetical protein PH5382_02010 [Phaeobacter sp. CECT 5382]|nr:hypothetical protein PH5382_02010 [Phaeobacter sp. CECT 5382]